MPPNFGYERKYNTEKIEGKVNTLVEMDEMDAHEGLFVLGQYAKAMQGQTPMER